jgi:predicted MFS family arabinose efflux permease
MTPSNIRPHRYSRSYVLYVVGLLSVVNLFAYMDRMALAVLAPSIKAELHLSDSQLGLLTGFAFAAVYAICGIPIARWADCGVRRNVIVTALSAWSTMTALCGMAQNIWQLFLARFGVGAGEAGCFPPAQSIICDYVRPERRSSAFALHSFGAYAGIMVGMTLAGMLAGTIGWRATFLALGIPGIALAVIVALTLKEPKRGAYDALTAGDVRFSFRETLRYLWSCKTYRLLVVFDVLGGFIQYGLNQWWPSFYERSFDMSVAAVGAYLGTAIGVGSGLGILIGGFTASAVAKHDVRLPLKFGAVMTLIAFPTCLASLLVSSATVSLWMVTITGFLWALSYGPMVAAFYSVIRPRMRATAGATGILIQSFLGFGLGPLCVGIASDLLAPMHGAESLRYALLIPASLVPFMAVTLWAATKPLLSDLAVVTAKDDDGLAQDSHRTASTHMTAPTAAEETR